MSLFHTDAQREYVRCESCRLVFVPAAWHLSAVEEKAVYDCHQNSPDDSRYRKFLSRMLEPVVERILPESHGLDFGSGPGPTLSVMFQELGHQVAIFDPYYANDESVLEKQYDFVTATEVVEHFCDPAISVQQVWSCVRPGGLLGVMTKMVLDEASFRSWHYKNDPTHVSFFARETFEWLAGEWSADVTFVGSDVAVFGKP